MTHEIVIHSYGTFFYTVKGTKEEIETLLTRIANPPLGTIFVDLGNDRYIRPNAVTSFSIHDLEEEKKQKPKFTQDEEGN